MFTCNTVVLQGTVRIEDELQRIKDNWPYLLMVKHDTKFQILVVAERQIVTEVGTLWKGLKSIIGAYVAFTLSTPDKYEHYLLLYSTIFLS